MNMNMSVKAVNVVLFEQLDDLQMHLEHLDERHGESTNQGNVYRLIYKPLIIHFLLGCLFLKKMLFNKLLDLNI